MGYELSLNNAWAEFGGLKPDTKQITFLNERYEINLNLKSITSTTNDVELKDYYKILVLHYIINESKVSQIDGEEWISFKEMDGGAIYFPAFRKRAIEPILNKYGDDPAVIYERAGFLNAEKISMGNVGLAVNAFPKVKAAIVLWEKDDEFDAECNMLFNSSVKKILPTEDVAVLGGLIASRI